MIPTKWDLHYLNLAKEISTWSKDPSTKIGAVAVGKHGQILATGYNGFPRGIEDSVDRLTNRETKYSYMIHGEMNCIYNATLTGVSLDNATLYVHGLPVCSDCAKGVAQVGIKKVFACHPVTISSKWEQSNLLTKSIFEEIDIDYMIITDGV